VSRLGFTTTPEVEHHNNLGSDLRQDIKKPPGDQPWGLCSVPRKRPVAGTSPLGVGRHSQVGRPVMHTLTSGERARPAGGEEEENREDQRSRYQ
jgi:hypothetical protein